MWKMNFVKNNYRKTKPEEAVLRVKDKIIKN